MVSKAEVTTFIQTYGALTLAIYAIVQVWVIALWKRISGKLTIFETGGVDLGFGGFGPAITLTGTFRAERKDMFIRKVDLRVVREVDNATFALEWLAFKAPEIKIGDPTATTFEVPSGINVLVSQPKRYSIVFCDKKIQNTLNRQLIRVSQEWRRFLLGKQQSIQRALKNSTEAEVLESCFAEFVTTTVSQTALEMLTASNWLRSGSYKITMETRTASPDKTFRKEWRYFLDDQLRLGLEGNALAVLRELCLGKLEYFYASLEFV
jgi:hypothetical protein